MIQIVMLTTRSGGFIRFIVILRNNYIFTFVLLTTVRVLIPVAACFLPVSLAMGPRWLLANPCVLFDFLVNRKFLFLLLQDR